VDLVMSGTGDTAQANRSRIPAEIAELTDPSSRKDPYPALARLRERSPYRPFDGLVVVLGMPTPQHCCATRR
jgi:hypothetical protein